MGLTSTEIIQTIINKVVVGSSNVLKQLLLGILGDFS